ncbi:MAG: NTP transferase domain-containing protein [Actinomycetota bacterium]|nr:NTP transferase domain-containing protein [Actinomycetota bacterium]
MSSALAPVHVVVLAAGCGSRLGELGGETPKWLREVGGRTRADRQLEGILGAGEAVASINVVAGHAAHAIEDALADRAEEVRVVSNPEFAELNNWWSLLLGLRELPGDGPVVVVNADLLADPADVASFVRAAAGGDADALLAVDLERPLTDESMKVACAADGALDRIGKVGVDSPVGEYIGMLAARGAALRALRAELERFVGREAAANEWYEAAVAATAAAGVRWQVWPTPSTAWVEIDDDDDLDAARALVEAS